MRRSGELFRSPFRLICALALLIYLLAAARVALLERLPPWGLFDGSHQANWAFGVNLVPLANYSMTEMYRNIALAIPFGVLLPLVTRWRIRTLIAACVCFGMSIELAQLGLDLAYGSVFHSIDINDAICNTLGALLGLGIVIGVRRIESQRSVATEEEAP